MSSIGKKVQAGGKIYLGSILSPLKLANGHIQGERAGGSCNGHTGEVREGNSCR